MKKTVFALFFFSACLASEIKAENNPRSHMERAYQRIRKTLILREKNSQLKKKHLVKANLHFKDNSETQGIIRFFKNTIQASSRKNGEKERLELKTIDRIEITSWKRIRLRLANIYVKYKFIPATIKAITKKGKSFYINFSDFKTLNCIYLFLPDDTTLKASASFTLYYNLSKKRYYNTNKPMGYHVENAPKNTITSIKFLSYSYDSGRHPIVSPETEGTVQIKMKKTPSQLYFERQRKLREEQNRAR
jgi:hypothetical protein